MQVTLLALFAVAAVSVAGQAGAYIVTRLRTKAPGALIALVALAAGAMAGEALLHAIPEATEAWEGHDVRGMGLVLTAGFAVTMVAGALFRHRRCCGPRHAGGDDPAMSLTLGDSLCNFADGIAIAASFLVSVPLGIAAAVAILVHEVPQEAGQCAALLRAGVPARRALALNAASAATAFLGAGLVLALPLAGAELQRFVLPAVAGAFLHIAAADLLPQIRPNGDSRRLARTGAGFAAGLAVMVALLAFEA